MNKSLTMVPSTADNVVRHDSLMNHCWRGIMLVYDVTVREGNRMLLPYIRVRDENGDFNEIIWEAAAAIEATGEYTYLFYPEAKSADFDGTEAVALILPQEWQLYQVFAGLGDFTYSVRGHYIK